MISADVPPVRTGLLAAGLLLSAALGAGHLLWGLPSPLGGVGGGAFPQEFSKEIERIDAPPVILEDALNLVAEGRVSIVMLKPEKRGTGERWDELVRRDGTAEAWMVRGIDAVLIGNEIGERPVLANGSGTIGLTLSEWCQLSARVAEYNSGSSDRISVWDVRESMYSAPPQEFAP